MTNSTPELVMAAWGRRFMAAMPLLLCFGCGGGGSTDSTPDSSSQEPALVGTVTAGFAEQTVSPTSETFPGQNPPAQIRAEVRGSSGYPRQSSTIDPDGTQQYDVALTLLDGPYLAKHTIYTDDSVVGDLYSAAPARGRANLTPLTTLLVAQLLGVDPKVAFDSYISSSTDTIARITDANIAAAQAKVTSYLTNTLGVNVRSGGASFTSSYFVPKVGDAMYDTIVELNTKLAAAGTTLTAVADTIAAESRLCIVESLSITVGGSSSDFCPKSKTSTLDAIDSTVNVYGFVDSKGDVLTVRARDGAVMTVAYTAADGSSDVCSSSGCTGFTLSALDADNGRNLVFASTPLAGAAGVVTLNGTLHGNKPGVSFPTLACSTNNYFIAYPDGRVEAACAAIDTTLGVGIGDAYALNATQTRVVHTFSSDGTVQPTAAQLEVRTNGDTVESIFVRDVDPDTGSTRSYYKCRLSECNGVSVGPAVDDVGSFAPYIVRSRTITIADAVVPAINADGSPSTAGPITVRASINSFQLVTPDGVNPPEDSCPSNPTLLTVTTTDGSAPEGICPPPDTGAGPFLFTDIDFDTNLSPRINVYNSAGGNRASSVIVRMDGETLLGVTYTNLLGDQYSCSDSLCVGVTVSAPNGAGERTVSLSGTVLQEIETAGLINPGQTATVHGAFVAPPP